MRKTLMGLASLMILTACGDGADSALKATCSTVIADPQIQRDLIAGGLSTEEFCACTSTQIFAMSEDERDTAISTFEMIEASMVENGGSVEAAFQTLSDARRADDATPEDLAAYENMDELGEQLEDYLDAMQAAGGVCPV